MLVQNQGSNRPRPSLSVLKRYRIYVWSLTYQTLIAVGTDLYIFAKQPFCHLDACTVCSCRIMITSWPVLASNRYEETKPMEALPFTWRLCTWMSESLLSHDHTDLANVKALGWPKAQIKLNCILHECRFSPFNWKVFRRQDFVDRDMVQADSVSASWMHTRSYSSVSQQVSAVASWASITFKSYVQGVVIVMP
jgi:hypothetical protein